MGKRLDMRVALMVAMAIGFFYASQTSAKSTGEVYRLPAPLSVDPVAGYELPEGTDPKPRRGMVLHGYRYDAIEGPNWKTAELANQAGLCGKRLKLPDSVYRSGDPDQPVAENFWLIYAQPEALLITQRATMIALENCTASADFSLEVDRLFFNAHSVTELRWRGGTWRSPSTLPVTGFANGAGPFLPISNLDSLKKRYRKTTYRQAVAALPNARAICFGVGSSIDSIQQCHLDEPGPYRGLMLSRTMFHTATYDGGTIVDHLQTDVLIDGRLFEWDREISLAK